MHIQRNTCKILQNNVEQYLHKIKHRTLHTAFEFTISEVTKMFFYSVVHFVSLIYCRTTKM